MSVKEVSPALKSRILALWREKPLRPEMLAVEFIKQYPHVELTKRQIADVVKRNKQYVMLADTKPKHEVERFAEYQQKRGSLVFVDSAHLRRHYIRGPHFVVLATDAFSKATYMEGIKRLTGASVAHALLINEDDVVLCTIP